MGSRGYPTNAATPLQGNRALIRPYWGMHPLIRPPLDSHEFSLRMKALRLGWRRQQFHTSLQRILCKEAESWHPNPHAGWRAWIVPSQIHFNKKTTSLSDSQIVQYQCYICYTPQKNRIFHGESCLQLTCINFHLPGVQFACCFLTHLCLASASACAERDGDDAATGAGSTWALKRNAKRWTHQEGDVWSFDENQFVSVYSNRWLGTSRFFVCLNCGF